jgi:hypothetical protein
MGLPGCLSNIPAAQEKPVTIRRQLRPLALVASVLAPVMAQDAHGQEPDPNVPVTARPRPDFDPLGIRAGGFLIYPSMTVGSSYNSNVFATENDTDDDFIFNFRPGINVSSNFPRHSINFGVQADIGRYVTETRENYEDVGTVLGGRLDITHSSRLTGALRFAKDHERRDDPEDPGAEDTRDPVEFYTYGANLGYQQEFNRFNVGVLGTFDRRDFDEQDEESDEDERDRNVYGTRLRTGYFISPRLNAFVQGGYRREQRDASNKSGRDNNTYSAAVGTEIDFTGLLFGEFFVGWSVQEFDESQFDSESGLDYGVNLTWNPTQLTSLRLTGGGGFAPSDVGASNLESVIALRVDHELLRNFLIGSEISYERDDFQDTNRTDNTINVGPSATYLMNRYVSLGAAYTYTTRDSDDSNREYDRHVVTFRVTGHL